MKAKDDTSSVNAPEPAGSHHRSSSTLRWWHRYLSLRLRGRPGLETTRQLSRWILLSPAIGLVAGLGAIALFWGINACTSLFLGRGAGYLPPVPAGEGRTVVEPVTHPWHVVLIVVIGGILAGLIVFFIAPEAEGHGTDSAIAAFHSGRPLRARIPLVKLVASAITIGSGGSGGREGPTAQISAGFASLLGQVLHLDERDRRIAIAAGMGAGIGAIFRAPLGGALLAAELPYLHDLEVEAIIPGLIASIVGYAVYTAWGGTTPIFGFQPNLTFDRPIQLAYYVLVGLACGFVGLCYSETFAWSTRFFHRLPLPLWFKPAIGALGVGLMALFLPQVLGMGYGWIQIAMGPSILRFPLWMLLLLPFAKIAATALSIGSGGSGGVFGPGMVIGGLTGAALWRLGHGILPGMPAGPAPFVIVGMMALFGGIAHAPVAVMLMVAEMTGNLQLLAPAMIAIAISTMVVGHHTIYTSQVDVRSDSPAHRSRLLALPRRAAVLIEQAVPASSKLDGQLLEDIQLPGGCLIVAIVRDDNVLIPRGNTRLLAGDILTLAVQRPFEERIREILQGWLQGSDATIPPPTEQSAAIVEEDHAI